mgnify:CR=1 FL=1
MHECTNSVACLEKQVCELQGTPQPIETIGSLLDHARRLYLRQLDPNRICPISGQAKGPHVEWDEVLPPFDGQLLKRLETIIATLERAFDGCNPKDPEYMKQGLAYVPTDKEYWSWAEQG